MNYITESQAEAIMKSLLDIEIRFSTNSQNPKKRNNVSNDGYHSADYKWNGHGYDVTQSDGLEDNYRLKIYVPGYINARLVYRSGKETDLDIDHNQLINEKILDVNLSDPLDSVVLTLTRNLAPPKTIKINYILADAERIKKERDDEARAELRKEMLSKMKIDAKAGNEMINVYFDPVSDKVNRIVLKLYLCDEITKKEEHSRMIGEFEPRPGTYFISVNNLVPGTYGYKVVQYLSDGTEPLVSSFRTIRVSSGNDQAFITY